jgi:hypothetical protein
MTRRPIQIRTKFRQQNPDVIRMHVRNGAAENIRVMLPKFRPDPNQVSHHKHALSGTVRLLKRDNSEPTCLTCIVHVKRVGSKWVTHRISQPIT